MGFDGKGRDFVGSANEKHLHHMKLQSRAVDVLLDDIQHLLLILIR